MSVRIIFEVKQNGPKIDLRLTTEQTPNATGKEKDLAKVAKNCLDEFLACVREAADVKQIPFTHTKGVTP